MTTNPLIGLTTAHKNETASIKLNYVDCVIEGGGTPVVLPVIDDDATIGEYVERLDGLILIGGPDLDPSLYGQQIHRETKPITDKRYAFERRLIERWLETGKPVLAICLGIQFINVVAGGSVIQHIPDQIDRPLTHHRKSPDVATHTIKIDPTSKLYGLFQEMEIEVNSYHHQSVDRLGEGLKVAATSDDGVIEAIEFISDRFGLFLQWHPERMAERKHRLAVFGTLVDACR